jgi:hypothetical protein
MTGTRTAGTAGVPPRPLLDVPLALALVGFGIAIAAAPSSIPGVN